jgi:hypothetical protein
MNDGDGEDEHVDQILRLEERDDEGGNAGHAEVEEKICGAEPEWKEEVSAGECAHQLGEEELSGEKRGSEFHDWEVVEGEGKGALHSKPDDA